MCLCMFKYTDVYEHTYAFLSKHQGLGACLYIRMLCQCMRICVHMCVNICAQLCMCVCVFCICGRDHMGVDVGMCWCVCANLCVYVRVCVRVPVCFPGSAIVHWCVRAHARARVCGCDYAYTRSYTRLRSCVRTRVRACACVHAAGG